MKKKNNISIQLVRYMLLGVLLLGSQAGFSFADDDLPVNGGFTLKTPSEKTLNDPNNDSTEDIAASIKALQSQFGEVPSDSIQKFKNRAFKYASEKDAKNASIYIEKFILSTLETSFINNSEFKRIKNEPEFQVLVDRYKVDFGLLNLFYLFTAIVGFFIAVILLIKRDGFSATNMLLSSFMLIHSVFILHIFLYNTNLKFENPNVLFMSICFSFLYGPLMYFYFKKVTEQYIFQKRDLLHLIPTAIMIAVAIPVYMLPVQEKLKVIFKVGATDLAFIGVWVFVAKLLSLIIYGYFIACIYKFKVKNNKKLAPDAIQWQKSILTLGAVYIVCYAVYGLIFTKTIPKVEFIFDLQLFAMAIMVLFIGVKAFTRPKLFSSELYEKHLNKYKKSGLTPRYSEELKTKLIYLMEEEKIYRQNDVNLETLAEKIGTTRHNASQIINEHFDLNFFELVNKYRIEEALEILQNDNNNNLNIIDVAYVVGFNNKVTFNKSFKKLLSLTPTQYLLSIKG